MPLQKEHVTPEYSRSLAVDKTHAKVTLDVHLISCTRVPCSSPCLVVLLAKGYLIRCICHVCPILPCSSPCKRIFDQMNLSCVSNSAPSVNSVLYFKQVSLISKPWLQKLIPRQILRLSPKLKTDKAGHLAVALCLGPEGQGGWLSLAHPLVFPEMR